MQKCKAHSRNDGPGNACARARVRDDHRCGAGVPLSGCVARGETVMHRVPRHENEHTPCNLYCHGDVHVDVIYLAPWLIAQAGTDLLSSLQGASTRSGYNESSEVLALSEAPE